MLTSTDLRSQLVVCEKCLMQAEMDLLTSTPETWSAEKTNVQVWKSAIAYLKERIAQEPQ